MNLVWKKYIGWNYDHNDIKWTVYITKWWKQIDVDLSKLTNLEFHIAYWRKANAIHKRFVDNVQDWKDDCGDYYVSMEDLQKLVEICKKVLASLESQKLKTIKVKNKFDWKFENVNVYPNVDLAMELLPPQEGFFFWWTQIDEWYVEDLKNTITQLSDLSDDYEYYYSSSR